jgi:hypothetical protein
MFTNQVNVLDLVLDYNMQEYGKIGLGRFAVPFGIQNPISPFNLTTINYSQVVTRTFGAGRDFGIRWTGKYNIVDWMVAGINGNDGGVYAVNTADDNSIKDIVGRVGVTPVKGLGIGASLYSGKTPVTVGGVVISNLPKDRTGFDVKYELDPVYLQGEYITAKDNTTNKMGYYAEAGYKIGKFQPVARYEAYDGDTSVEDNSEIKILAPGLNFYPNKSVKLQFIYELKTDKLSTSFTDKYNDAWYFQSSVKF